MMPWPTCCKGTIWTALVAVASRNPSYAKKKNARSDLIGPPTEPPKKFLSNCGRGNLGSPTLAVPLMTCGSVATKRPALLLKKSLAVVTVLRWYSNKEPCQLLEPDLVTSDTWAPDDRPESAFGLVVTTRNSCTASRITR